MGVFKLAHTPDAASAKPSSNAFTTERIQAWLFENLITMIAPPFQEAIREPPSIMDFRHVTCCDARWPDLNTYKAYYTKHYKKFRNLLKRLAAAVDEAESFKGTLIYLHKMLFQTSTNLLADRRQRSEDLMLMRRASRARTPPYPCQLLSDISMLHSKDRTRWDYGHIKIQVRCLAWILHESLDLEMRLLRNLEMVLTKVESMFSRQEPAPSLTAMMASFILGFNVSALFTNDMATHIYTGPSSESPVKPELAWEEVLNNRRDMCLNFAIDRNLRKYFQQLGSRTLGDNSKALEANVKMTEWMMEV